MVKTIIAPVSDRIDQTNTGGPYIYSSLYQVPVSLLGFINTYLLFYSLLFFLIRSCKNLKLNAMLFADDTLMTIEN